MKNRVPKKMVDLKNKEDAYRNCSNWIPLFPNGIQNTNIRADLPFEISFYDKKKYSNYNVGGCYMYAYSKKDLTDTTVKYLQKEIVYIGEAGSSRHRGILNRTTDFVGTLKYGFKQKQPSEHAIHFLAKYGIKNAKHLYVCYIPIGFGENIKKDSVFFEDLLLQDYAWMYGDFPVLNLRVGILHKTILMYESLSFKEQKKMHDHILKSLDRKIAQAA